MKNRSRYHRRPEPLVEYVTLFRLVPFLESMRQRTSCSPRETHRVLERSGIDHEYGGRRFIYRVAS